MYSHTYGSGTRITRPSEEPARVARSKDTQSPPSHWKTYYQTQLGLVLKVNSVWKPSGAGVDPRTERNEATRSADDVRHPNSSVHPLYISSVIQPRSFSVEAKKCITRSRALKALKGQSDRSGTQSSDDQGGSGDRDESTPSSDGGQQVRLEVKLLQRTPGGRRSPSPRSSYTDLGQQSPNTPRPTSLVPLSLPETGRISPSPKQAKPHHPSTWLEPLSGRQDGKHPTGDKTINERNLQWNKQLQDDFGISHWPASASDVLTKHRRGSSREVSSEGKPSLEPLDHSHHDKFQSVHDKLFRHKNTTDSRKGKEHNSGNSKDGKVTHTEDSEDSALGSEKRDEPCETTTKENSPTGTRDSKTADKDMVPTASPMRGRLKYTVCPQGASANLPPNNQLLKTLSNAQLDARLTARTSSSSTSASLRIHLSVPAVPPDEDKEASPSGEPHTQSVAHSSEDGTTSTAGGKHHTRYRQFWKRGSRQGKDGSRDRHSRGSRSVEVTSADTVESSLSDAGTTTLAQSCLKDGRLARQVEKSLERRLARRMVSATDIVNAEKFFGTLAHITTSQLPQSRLLALLGEKKKQLLGQTDSSRKGGLDARLVDRTTESVGRAGLTYVTSDHSNIHKVQEQTSRRMFVKSYIREMMQQAVQTDKKRARLQQLWPCIFNEMVQTAVLDMWDSQQYMKVCLDELERS